MWEKPIIQRQEQKKTDGLFQKLSYSRNNSIANAKIITICTGMKSSKRNGQSNQTKKVSGSRAFQIPDGNGGSKEKTGMERPAESRMPVRRMVLPLSEETEAVRADTSLEMAVWIPETVMLQARI